jgi:hypothetical protein
VRVLKEIGPLIANDTMATQWLQARTLQYRVLTNRGDNLKTCGLLIGIFCLIWSLII